MIDRDIKRIIEKYPLALATICSDKSPHVIAVAYVKVIDKDKILITDNYMKTTKNNILKDGKVALCVWNDKWRGWRLKGIAEYYGSGPWLKRVKEMPENKGLPAKGAIIVNIKEVTKLE